MEEQSSLSIKGIRDIVTENQITNSETEKYRSIIEIIDFMDEPKKNQIKTIVDFNNYTDSIINTIQNISDIKGTLYKKVIYDKKETFLITEFLKPITNFDELKTKIKKNLNDAIFQYSQSQNYLNSEQLEELIKNGTYTQNLNKVGINTKLVWESKFPSERFLKELVDDIKLEYNDAEYSFKKIIEIDVIRFVEYNINLFKDILGGSFGIKTYQEYFIPEKKEFVKDKFYERYQFKNLDALINSTNSKYPENILTISNIRGDYLQEIYKAFKKEKKNRIKFADLEGLFGYIKTNLLPNLLRDELINKISNEKKTNLRTNRILLDELKKELLEIDNILDIKFNDIYIRFIKTVLDDIFDGTNIIDISLPGDKVRYNALNLEYKKLKEFINKDYKEFELKYENTKNYLDSQPKYCYSVPILQNNTEWKNTNFIIEDYNENSKKIIIENKIKTCSTHNGWLITSIKDSIKGAVLNIIVFVNIIYKLFIKSIYLEKQKIYEIKGYIDWVQIKLFINIYNSTLDKDDVKIKSRANTVDLVNIEKKEYMQNLEFFNNKSMNSDEITMNMKSYTEAYITLKESNDEYKQILKRYNLNQKINDKLIETFDEIMEREGNTYKFKNIDNPKIEKEIRKKLKALIEFDRESWNSIEKNIIIDNQSLRLINDIKKYIEDNYIIIETNEDLFTIQGWCNNNLEEILFIYDKSKNSRNGFLSPIVNIWNKIIYYSKKTVYNGLKILSPVINLSIFSISSILIPTIFIINLLSNILFKYLIWNPIIGYVPLFKLVLHDMIYKIGSLFIKILFSMIQLILKLILNLSILTIGLVTGKFILIILRNTLLSAGSSIWKIFQETPSKSNIFLEYETSIPFSSNNKQSIIVNWEILQEILLFKINELNENKKLRNEWNKLFNLEKQIMKDMEKYIQSKSLKIIDEQNQIYKSDEKIIELQISVSALRIIKYKIQNKLKEYENISKKNKEINELWKKYYEFNVPLLIAYQEKIEGETILEKITQLINSNEIIFNYQILSIKKENYSIPEMNVILSKLLSTSGNYYNLDNELTRLTPGFKIPSHGILDQNFNVEVKDNVTIDQRLIRHTFYDKNLKYIDYEKKEISIIEELKQRIEKETERIKYKNINIIDIFELIKN